MLHWCSWWDVPGFLDQQRSWSIFHGNHWSYSFACWNNPQNGHNKRCRVCTLGQGNRFAQGWEEGRTSWFHLYVISVSSSPDSDEIFLMFDLIIHVIYLFWTTLQADIVVVNPSSWSMMPIHDWYAIILTHCGETLLSRDSSFSIYVLFRDMHLVLSIF